MINIDQLQFNLTIIREGLNALAASSTEQLALNKNGLPHLDDIFDPMPMDYFIDLEKTKIVTPSFAKKYEDLYKQIDQSVGHLEWQEEDVFIKQNNLELQEWRKIAKELLNEVNNV